MKVTFVDLRPLHEEVRTEIEAAFKDVFDHSSFVGGLCVDTFEKDFASYCGVNPAVACVSGTDSVKLALIAAEYVQAMRSSLFRTPLLPPLKPSH